MFKNVVIAECPRCKDSENLGTQHHCSTDPEPGLRIVTSCYNCGWSLTTHFKPTRQHISIPGRPGDEETFE